MGAGRAEAKVKGVRIDIRVSAEERARWTAAAKALGLTLSAWLRMLATKASPRR